MNTIMEILLIGLLIFCVSVGNFCEKIIPATTGIPKRIVTVRNISSGSISIGRSKGEVAEYRPPQKAKLRGVKSSAKTVPAAVRLMESGTLALATLEIKFETLPPGHEATSIIPKATEGVKYDPKAKTATKVIAGNNKNWLDSPMITLRGLMIMSFIWSHLMPNATPNIINPIATFMICRLAGLKFKRMESSNNRSSCIYLSICELQRCKKRRYALYVP